MCNYLNTLHYHFIRFKCDRENNKFLIIDHGLGDLKISRESGTNKLIK